MNTKTVPTEWLEELYKINDNLIKHTVNEHGTDGAHEFMLYLGKLQGHIKASKYFQPQPDSVDLVDPEEFLKWWSLEDVDYKFYKSTWHKHGTNGLEPCPFSEVLEAFKKSKG